MTKQIWLVEWTREDAPNEAPSLRFEEAITVDTIASDITWTLFKSDYDTVSAMVDRTGGGWRISEAPDGEYIDCGGDSFVIRDGEIVEAVVFGAGEWR